jgi:hypothetical protein
MSVDPHEGVVAFRPLTPGRQAIVLGLVDIGEISPTLDPRSRFPVCFRLDLPCCSSRAWTPARDVDDAKRQALIKISDWLDAADLCPNNPPMDRRR